MTKAVHALILAAGKGVRFRSALPKVLHPICGVSMLERVLRTLAELRPEGITIVVGYGEEEVRKEVLAITGDNKPSVRTALDGLPVNFVRQEEQLGTGHAVQVALPVLSQTANILILPGDTPFIRSDTLRRLVETLHTEPYDLVFLSSKPPSPTGYGRVIRDSAGNVRAIVEERDATPEIQRIRETNGGIYLARSGFLHEVVVHLNRKNTQNEFYLTDIVEYGVLNGKKVSALVVEDSLEVAGANSRLELSALEAKRRKEIVRDLMFQGVSFEDPERAYIDEDVFIGRDSFIGAGTRLRRGCVLGEQVTVDGEALIADSTVGARTHIKLGCVITSATIGEDCRVGPFAHLRPGSCLHSRVMLGNFVETKQAEFMDGAKANHLSYVGDATVGMDTNIGAGTITCNYDGYEKHRTTFGERVFVGSNTALVAPVTIGSGSVIGAGSTITRDVPAGALAIARSEQVNHPGWAERRSTERKKER